MGSQDSTPACRAGATTVGAIQGLQLQPWKRDPDLGPEKTMKGEEKP